MDMELVDLRSYRCESSVSLNMSEVEARKSGLLKILLPRVSLVSSEHFIVLLMHQKSSFLLREEGAI